MSRAMYSAAALAAATLVGFSFPAVGQSACPAPKVAGAAMLDIQVEGVRSGDGTVTITVYPDDPDRFLARGGRLSRERIQAVAPVTPACIEVPGPGTYAIAVYHDENKDRKFNTTLLGLPDEGYGFSRNPGGLIAIPSFDEVKFTADPGATRVEIKLTY